MELKMDRREQETFTLNLCNFKLFHFYLIQYFVISMAQTYMRPHPNDVLLARQRARSGWKVEIFM